MIKIKESFCGWMVNYLGMVSVTTLLFLTRKDAVMAYFRALLHHGRPVSLS
jgi:hypothetical protein